MFGLAGAKTEEMDKGCVCVCVCLCVIARQFRNCHRSILALLTNSVVAERSRSRMNRRRSTVFGLAGVKTEEMDKDEQLEEIKQSPVCMAQKRIMWSV